MGTKCKEHPRYTGKYVPRSKLRCRKCWRIFQTESPNKAVELLNKNHPLLLEIFWGG